MANIRKWMDKGNKSALRVPSLLPLLIRQARLETPITYGDVAKELGVHHRAVDRIAGYIGWTLEAVGNSRGWKRRPPPPLHSLVVNDVTHLPGRGINGFMSSAYQAAKSPVKKRSVLKAVYSDLNLYEHWDELCDLLEVPTAGQSLDRAIEQAVNSRGRGGEGPEHRALKEHIAAHPEEVGLAAGSADGIPEYPIASGDRIDVVFERRGLRLAVEVKPACASEGDKIRGVFQCLKYRTVLEAQSALSDSEFNTRVVLVLGGEAPDDVIKVANRLGVAVIDRVVVA